MSASIWNPGTNNIPTVNPAQQVKSEKFTATEGQTDFVITQFTYALNSGAIDVFVNMSKILHEDIKELSTSSFRIPACYAGDVVEVSGNIAIQDPSGAVVLVQKAALDAEAARVAAEAAKVAATADAANAVAARIAAEAAAAAAALNVPINWRGAWASGVSYAKNDAFSNAGSSYLATAAHVSTTLAADIGAGLVAVLAQAGTSSNTASAISFTPAGTIAASNVQLAIEELDSETQAALALKANLATSVQKTSNTGAARIPAGTTGQRDASPVIGDTRFNTTLGKNETWDGLLWKPEGGGGATGPGNDEVFNEVDQFLTAPWTIGHGALVSGATISIANPAVITLPNSFVAGQPVRFTTTGALPTGLDTNARYFVLSAGLSSSSFQVSATVEGTPIATSGTQSGVHSCGKVKNASHTGELRFAVGANVTVPVGSRLSFN